MAAARRIFRISAASVKQNGLRYKGFALVIIWAAIAALPAALEHIALYFLERFGLIGAAAQTLTALDPCVYASTAAKALLWLLIVPPLSVGAKLWFFEAASGKGHALFEAFGFFTSARLYSKAILLRVIILLRQIAAWASLALPAAILLFLLDLLQEGEAPGTVLLLIACTAALGLVQAVFVLLFCLRYYLCDYLYAREPKLALHEVIRRSVRLMRGRKAQTFTFLLAALLRLTLCALVVPALFVLPRLAASLALYAMQILSEGEMVRGKRRGANAVIFTQFAQTRVFESPHL